MRVMQPEGMTGATRNWKRQEFCFRASGGSVALQLPPFHTSGFQNHKRILFCSFKPPGLLPFVHGSLRK